MFIRVLLALLLLVGLMWLITQYSRANDQQRSAALRNILIYGVGLAILLLVITGRIPAFFALISAAIPFYRRLLALRGLVKFFGPSLGHTKLTTQWLIVQYNFNRKTLDAEVIQGEFAGRSLSQLSDEQLSSLMQACKQDIQSRAALHAYMALRNNQQQQQSHNSDTAKASDHITKQQAYEILGLNNDAGEDEIKRAHKKLMQKLHPDRGGSTYLAAQINAAKDILLKP